MRRFAFLALLLLAISAVSGCGHKGPLFMPRATPAAAGSVAAPATTSAVPAAATSATVPAAATSAALPVSAASSH